MDFSKKKITEILSLLTPKDLRNFRKFLSSPYHIKPAEQAAYLILLDTILNSQKRHSKMSEEEIFARLFPGKKYISGKVDKKISQLMEAALEFMGFEQAKAGVDLRLGAIRQIRKKSKANIYQREFNKLSKRFAQLKSNMLDADLRKFALDLEEFRHRNTDLYKVNQDSYDQIYNALDDLYMSYFLDIGIRNLAYNRFIVPMELKTRFDLLILLIDNKEAEAKSNKQLFQEQIFRQLIEDGPVDLESIQELSFQLENVKNEIRENHYKKFRIVIRNFVVYRYNSGDTELLPFLFQLYKREVEEETIYFFEQKVPSAVVNNIAVIALRAGEIDWLNGFLKEVSDKILEPDLKEYTLALNRAKLLFAQRQFEEVLDTLIYDVKEPYLKVNARLLELKTYFELNSDQLQYKLDAYKIFIYRLPVTKVGAEFIKGHNNFIKLLKSIRHPGTLHNEERTQKLINKIKATKILAERGWLLEQLKTGH